VIAVTNYDILRSLGRGDKAIGMHLIFDFDGTIVNSFCNVIEKFNILADEFHFRKIDASEINALRDMSSRELIKFLKIPLYKLPQVIHKARKFIHQDITSLSSFENLPAVLTKLYEAGFVLGILTSNSKENVTDWLHHANLQPIFQYVHSELNFFGKKFMLKKLIKKYALKAANVFYVGDETRDVEAARQSNISSIAVTWGFNSEKILRQANPTLIAKTPNDLLTIFNIPA